MQEPGAKSQRFDINYFDGVNSTVQRMLAKRQEFSHAENARTGTIGSIEKRRGQTKYGTATNGAVLVSDNNYGLFKFVDSLSGTGVFRVSSVTSSVSTLTLNTHDNVCVIDVFNPDGTTIYIKTVDDITVTEPTIYRRLDTKTIILDGTSSGASIYSLSTAGTWGVLSDTEANNIIGANFDTTEVDKNLVMVNQKDYNRYILEDGTTVIDSTQAGHLYNSPRAKKAAFYKNRIYLANFIRNGVKYGTTIARSSYPLGLVSLVNGDYVNDGAGGAWAIPVTDVKYFYADSGMNQYEVYRGPSKVATITLASVESTTITATNANVVFEGSYASFFTADEVWVKGTYDGAKQYRWMNNASSTGQDAKQYDTFKLSGPDSSDITLLEPVGNVLMMANKNSFLTWNDYSLQLFDQGVGCVSENGYTKLLGSLYFIHYTGIFATNGSTPTLLSRKVSRYIKGATRSGLENAAAGYKDLSVFFCIGDVTLYKNDGSYWKTLSDVCLEYNIADQNWFVHTNVPASRMLNFISSDGTERLLETHEGSDKSVKEFLDGNTDDGENIFFRVDLAPIQLMKEMEVYSNPISVITESERGSMIKCFVSTDNIDFYELQGNLEKGIRQIKVTSPDTDREQPIICHWIQLSLRDSSAQICRLTQASIVYLPGTMSMST